MIPKILSIHPIFDCSKDPRCDGCYMRKYERGDNFKLWEWLLLPKIAKKMGTEQITMGGGEVTLNPSFVREFAAYCKLNGIICNVTTNGQPLKDYPSAVLRMMFKNVNMVSVSFNEFLINSKSDIDNYMFTVKRLKKITKVGTNLLIDSYMVDHPKWLPKVVHDLFKHGVDRIYALHYKPQTYDILKIKSQFMYCTMRWKHFYVDDTINQIMKNGGYRNWKDNCHFAHNFLSITGRYLKGCSFQPDYLAKLDNLEDLPGIVKKLDIKGFNFCPALEGHRF